MQKVSILYLVNINIRGNEFHSTQTISMKYILISCNSLCQVKHCGRRFEALDGRRHG